MRRKIFAFLRGPLVSIANLIMHARVKPVVYCHDVQCAIKVIWMYKIFVALRTFWMSMSMSIILNLLVDGVERIGKILPSQKWDLEHKQYLTWECLQFIALPTTTKGRVEILVLVTFKWLKWSKFDINNWKVVPCIVVLGP